MRYCYLVTAFLIMTGAAIAAPGALLLTLTDPTPEPQEHFGQAVTSPGVPDRFVAGAPGAQGNRGRAVIFDTTGAPVRSIENPFDDSQSTGSFAASLCSVPNGFAAGAPYALTRGTVATYTGSDFLTTTHYDPPAGAETGYGAVLAASTTRLYAGNPFQGSIHYGSVYCQSLTNSSVTTLYPPPQANANFGSAINVLSSSYFVVGAPGTESNYVGGAISYYYQSTGPLYFTMGEPGGGQPGDRFGSSLASLGTTVVAGAPNVGSGTGRAFKLISNGILTQTFNPPAGGGGEFGFSAAAGDNYYAIGAPGYAAGSGRVYVYDGASGALLLTIENPTPGAGDRFGESIAFANSRIIIGAPGDDSVGTNAGAAYVFAGPLGPPVLMATPQSPTSILLEWTNDTVNASGFSLERRTSDSLSFSVIATLSPDETSYLDTDLPVDSSFCYRIRATSGNVNGNYSNVACASTPDGPIPNLLHAIENPDATTNTQFGLAVAAVGKKRFAVGAPGPGSIGSVYLFNASSGALERRIDNPRPDGYSGDLFGSAVGTLGDDLLVGAPGAETDYTGGAAYRFDSNTGQLLNTYSIPVLTTGVNAKFGTSVAGFGKTVAVGAPNSGIGATGAGVVFVLDADSGESVDTLFETNLVRGNQFGTRVAGTKKALYVTAPLTDTVGTDRGAVYGFDKHGIGIGWSGHAFSVGSAGNYAVVGAPENNSAFVTQDYGFAYLLSGSTVRRVYTNPATRLGDAFGYAVAGDKKLVLIGAPLYDGIATSTGRAYLLDQRTGSAVNTYGNPSPEADDRFGYSVALVGKNTLVIAAPLDNGAAPDSGAVYMFTAVTKTKKKK